MNCRSIFEEMTAFRTQNWLLSWRYCTRTLQSRHFEVGLRASPEDRKVFVLPILMRIC
ncbi:protein of unknown function (plasmid) [Cupriavidus taiwanensis]|uniref:hypothetical protein n=1 Tax=Cupriavidus taiwanensis TaxID=164546 RepID=UPI000E100B19|nr:protein of unknown function [Cupriavidus taiwanensis]